MNKKSYYLYKTMWFLRLLVGVYGIVSLYYWFFKLPAGSGDEGLMAIYLEEANSVGLLKYIGVGNFSIPHLLALYLPSQILPPFLALRIVTLGFTLFLYLYIIKRFPVKYPEFRYHLLFYLFSGSFFLGTNDTMMIFFLIIFFLECYRVIDGLDSEIASYAPIALVTAFFTREMTIIYFPIIFLAILLLWNKKMFSKRIILLTIGSFIFWIILNIPSLVKNQKISFDNKIQEKQMGVSWEQLQYLSQLYVNEGKLPENQHLKWGEVREYLNIHGEKSLPNSTLEAILFDPELTIKEAFKDFGSIMVSGLRQISLGIIFPFLVLVMFFFKKPLRRSLLFLSVSVLLMMIIFSIIIISYIEIRWLAASFLLSIMGLYIVMNDILNKNEYRLVNILVLILLNLYGIFTYFIRIME